MWHLAGIVGCDPGPLTLRELYWMAEAARREAWQHTAWLSAMIANANRDPKKKPSPFQPDDFNPLARRDRKAGAVVVDDDTIGDLKAMFGQVGRNQECETSDGS